MVSVKSQTFAVIFVNRAVRVFHLYYLHLILHGFVEITSLCISCRKREEIAWLFPFRQLARFSAHPNRFFAVPQ
jgi:hypothetical protein